MRAVPPAINCSCGAPPAVDRNASIRSKMPKRRTIRRQSYYSTRERARLSAALKALEVSVDISFVHKPRLFRYTGAICLDSALPFPYYPRLPFFWYRPEYWAARIKWLTGQQRGTHTRAIYASGCLIRRTGPKSYRCSNCLMQRISRKIPDWRFGLFPQGYIPWLHSE